MDNTENLHQADELQNQNAVSEVESEKMEDVDAHTQGGNTIKKQPESKVEKTQEQTEDKMEWPKEQRPVGDEEAKAKNEPPKKNLKPIIVAAIVVAVAAIIVFAVVPSLMTPDLSKFTPTKDMKVNSMSFKIPEDCKVEDSKADSYYLYSLNNNNKPIGVIEVEYRGDTDLEGNAGFDIDSAEHPSADKAIELIPEAKGTYQIVEADNSAFEVTVYADDEKVKGKDELLSAIVDSFDTSGYSNPREEDGITYKYTGDASDGVVIDDDVKGLEVWEAFNTSLGKGEKSTSFTVTEPVKLKAGKTSTVHITIDNGDKYTIDIKCSDDKPRPKFEDIAEKVKQKVMKSKYATNEMFTNFTVAYDWADEYEKGDFQILSNMESSAYNYLLTQETGTDAAMTWEMILLEMSNYCSDLKKDFTKEDYDCTVSFYVWAPGDWKGVKAFSYVNDEGIQLNPYAG